jgi:hypothetical protein
MPKYLIEIELSEDEIKTIDNFPIIDLGSDEIDLIYKLRDRIKVKRICSMIEGGDA